MNTTNIRVIGNKRNIIEYVLEIWHSKELLWVLVWRDLKVRYKQTLLGIIWVLLQPLFSMLIFTLFFGKVAKIPSGSLPYSLFSLVGLSFWNFFSNSLAKVSDSIVNNENIIKKIYFPRVIFPLSAFFSSVVDFFVNFLFLLFFAMILGFYPRVETLYVVPGLFLMTFFSSFGAGLFLASVNVRYRDVRYILPFFIQISMFLTPVIYPLSIVGQSNRFIMALNPMTFIIEASRWLFLKGEFLYGNLFWVSFPASLILILFGYYYFSKAERKFTDYV